MPTAPTGAPAADPSAAPSAAMSAAPAETAAAATTAAPTAAPAAANANALPAGRAKPMPPKSGKVVSGKASTRKGAEACCGEGTCGPC